MGNGSFKKEEWFWLHQILCQIRNRLVEYGIADDGDFLEYEKKEYEKMVSQPEVPYSIDQHKKAVFLLEKEFKAILNKQKY